MIYTHDRQERLNYPPVGLVTPDTDKDGNKKQYQYDPQLVWAGKAEHTSFDVPTVSLHVHERIDPKLIIEQVRKEQKQEAEQMSLFSAQEKRPLREAVEFYKHKDGWTNQLIAGDSCIVMNSLLEKEGMGEKVQVKSRLYHIYMDKDVKDDINSKAEETEPLPDLITNAYYLLGKDWLKTRKAWQEVNFPVPPVMITVANRTETSSRIKYIRSTTVKYR